MMAGLYFAFSTFIMSALGRIPQAHGISAMQSINATILQSLFMPLFWGTTLSALALAGFALFRLGETAATAMLAAGILYVVGMFVCTVVFNVPLNNALDAVDPAGAEGAAVWTRYLKGLDVLESSADGGIRRRERIVHGRHRGAIGAARSLCLSGAQRCSAGIGQSCAFFRQPLI